MEELEQADKGTEAEDQGMTIEAAILTLEERKAELEGYLEQVTRGEETQVSLTDPDSRLMKTKDGMSVCLNVQTAVDSKNKMVVEFAVCNQVQDKNLMSPMAEKVSEILDAGHIVMVADNGYGSVSDVAQVLAGNNLPVVCGGDYQVERQREKFELEHENELRTFHMTRRKLDKYRSSAGKSPFMRGNRSRRGFNRSTRPSMSSTSPSKTICGGFNR